MFKLDCASSGWGAIGFIFIVIFAITFNYGFDLGSGFSDLYTYIYSSSCSYFIV